jgi:hypothetical protein
MTYNVSGGAILGADENLTTSAATTVLGPAKSNTIVLSVVCCETGGATPNLTIAKTNGVRTIHYRNAKAMTARETVVFETPIFLRAGWSLKVTSSNASGLVDVDVTYLDPNKLSA